MSSLADVRRAALNFIARREHSQFELHQKLERKCFSIDAIKQVLEKLADEGLQSDARFCEAYVRMRLKQGFGPDRIRLELTERHVAESLIRDVLHHYASDFETRLYEVIGKKFPEVSDDYHSRAKQMRFLHYRGFPTDMIRRALNEVV